MLNRLTIKKSCSRYGTFRVATEKEACRIKRGDVVLVYDSTYNYRFTKKCKESGTVLDFTEGTILILVNGGEFLYRKGNIIKKLSHQKHPELYV